MKAVVFHHPGKVSVDNVLDPKIEHAEDVILRVTTTAICGSDLHIFNGFLPQKEDMVLEGSPHVMAVTVTPTLKFLGMEKITLTGRQFREVAFEEFSSLLRHRNHTLFSVLNSKVGERGSRPGQVAYAQDPLPDPTWQRMVDFFPPQPEVKTENQKELKMIVLGSRDESVALLASREPTIRSRLRLFDHDIHGGIVRNLSRAVCPPKQARNAREVGSGRVIRHAGTLGVVPFPKIAGGNCSERFCDTRHKR
jgi:hypothetical protein